MLQVDRADPLGRVGLQDLLVQIIFFRFSHRKDLQDLRGLLVTLQALAGPRDLLARKVILDLQVSYTIPINN